MAKVDEIPGSGSLRIEYVDAFNALVRRAVPIMDVSFAYFSDIIYDANVVVREWLDMHRPETSALVWYVRDCGTVIQPYYEDDRSGIDDKITHYHRAVFLIEVERMEYGCFNMTVSEYAGPFCRG